MTASRPTRSSSILDSTPYTTASGENGRHSVHAHENVICSNQLYRLRHGTTPRHLLTHGVSKASLLNMSSHKKGAISSDQNLSCFPRHSGLAAGRIDRSHLEALYNLCSALSSYSDRTSHDSWGCLISPSQPMSASWMLQLIVPTCALLCSFCIVRG